MVVAGGEARRHCERSEARVIDRIPRLLRLFWFSASPFARRRLRSWHPPRCSTNASLNSIIASEVSWLVLSSTENPLNSLLGHGHVARRGLATVVDAPKQHRLAVGILLNRSPILTRTPTKLEREFYKYQQRIQRALHNPFPHEFYFKQGSVLEAQFNQDEIRRERKAFGPSFVKDKEDKSSLLMNLETSGEEDEKPMPRRSEADDKKDVKSLDRHGTRNMYLLVKGVEGDEHLWRFPKGYVETGEMLHEVSCIPLTSFLHF